MGIYNCSKCDWSKEIFYDTGKDIREVIKHDRTHMGNKKTESREEKVPCKHCDGNGYTLDTYDIEIDVSETDSGRDK